MSSLSGYKKGNVGFIQSDVSTRIGIFLGLDFTTNQTMELNTKKYLSSIPSFSFSSDYTRVLIDYSNSKNQTDLSLLDGLFAGLTAGFTFTISDAAYSIDGQSSFANLGGTYSFKNYIGNVIVAEPVTVNNTNQRLQRYEASYFTTPPQFGLSLAPKKLETEYVIMNALSSDKINSFDKFGIYPDDRIKITGTRFNNGTYTVKTVKLNKDGSEVMTVVEGVTQESAFGNRVGIELVQTKRGSLEITAATGPVVLGVCGVYTNGVLVFCYENQTRDQCLARTSMTGGTPFTWLADRNCNSLPSTVQVAPTSIPFVPPTMTTNPLASLANLGYL